MDLTSWDRLKNRDQVWKHMEFIDRRENWDQSLRVISCRLFYKD